MNETTLLEHLEEITSRLGIDLRYENLVHGRIRTEGGYCKVAGKPMILINRRESRRSKIRILTTSLKKLDLEGIFIPPGVRKLIENQDH